MLNRFMESIWFLLPLLAANVAPGLARGLRLPFSRMPVSIYWLGESKTIGAYYAGPLFCTLALYAEREVWPLLTWRTFGYGTVDLFWVGVVLGLGVVLGDHIESFIKRRLKKPPGTKWWPWDAVDFALGGILFAIPVVGWIGFEEATLILWMVIPIHYIGNEIGYQLGFRKTPW